MHRGGLRTPFLSWLLAVGMLPACLLGITVARGHAVFASVHDKVCDYGADGLQIIRASHLHECLGPYSRFRFHHPGPISFYYFAAMERLVPIGWGQGAHLLYQLLLNVGLLGWILHVTYRSTRRASMALCLGSLIVLVMSGVTGMAFFDPWAPVATILPFLLFAVAAASVATGYTRHVLPLSVGATVSVQNQVGFVPSVLFVLLLTAVLFLQRYRYRTAGLSGRDIAALALAAIFVGASFAPPLHEELTSRGGGNFSMLYSFFTAGGDRHSLHETASYFGYWFAKVFCGWEQTAKPPMWIAATSAALALASVCGGLLLRDRFVRSLAIVLLACLAVPVWAALRIRGAIEDYQFLYYFGVLAACYFTGCAVLERVLPMGLFRKAVVPTVAVVALGGVLRMPSPAALVQEPSYIDRLCRALAPEPNRTYRLIWDSREPGCRQWGIATGIAYRMTKQGFPVCVSDDWTFMFGRDLASSGKRAIIPVYLFNADEPEAAAEALPVDIRTNVVCGPTRMVVGTWPALAWPIELKHDALDGYFVGFDRAEHGYRWSVGKRSAIEFVPKGVPRMDEDLVLSLTCGSLGPQQVGLLFNHRDLGVLHVTATSTLHQVRIPRDSIVDGQLNTLEWIVPDARRPGSGDPRELGISFVSLRLDAR